MEKNASHGVNKGNVHSWSPHGRKWRQEQNRSLQKTEEKEPKPGGGLAETELDTVSTAISTILPQHINSIGYAFDDDASLHGNLKKNHIADEMVLRNNKWKVPALYIFYPYQNNTYLKINAWFC